VLRDPGVIVEEQCQRVTFLFLLPMAGLTQRYEFGSAGSNEWAVGHNVQGAAK